MQRRLSIPVGVVVTRDKIDHPWQEYAWRPVSVFLGAPDIREWRELRRDAASIHYHAATLELELHAKEADGYRANLDTGRPLVYVVLREASQGQWPVEVAAVLASPYDAEVYGYNSNELVDGVTMPEPLAEFLEAFVAEHLVEEAFIKRPRQKHHRTEEHKFGQEPLDALRRRMGRQGDTENE
jgi:hypothetical protein